MKREDCTRATDVVWGLRLPEFNPRLWMALSCAFAGYKYTANLSR